MHVQISPECGASPRRAGRPRRAGWSSQDGFTITESVTGLSILFVVILALVASVSVAVRGIVTGRQRSTALSAAEEVMEEIRSVDYERIGHTVADSTLASGCSATLVPPGSGTTDWFWNGRTYEHAAGGEAIAIATAGTPVVGGAGQKIAAHCTTGTLDNTQYEQWVYVTIVDPAAGDPHKRVTVVVEFLNDQYGGAVENRAKISSLVSPGDRANQPLISVRASAGAGEFTLTDVGATPSSIDSFTATYATSQGDLWSHVWDLLSGRADYAAARMEADGVTADNPPCSVVLNVATCAAGRAQPNGPSADDDPGTSSIVEYPTPGSVAGAAGKIEVDDLDVDWDGGSGSATLSACYGGPVGTCGPAFATPPFTAWPAAYPAGRHLGLGPDDFRMTTTLDLPGSLASVPVDWVNWVGDAEAESTTAQQAAGGSSKLTTPTARTKVPAVSLAKIAGVSILGVSEVELTAAAPVGYGALDADVTATLVTIDVAGTATALTIDPAGGGAVSAAPVTLSLGSVVVTFDLTAVAGNLTEIETRTGLTVEDSTASLLDALVITLNVRVVACGAGNTDVTCTLEAIPPTTVADLRMELDYGDVAATGKHGV